MNGEHLSIELADLVKDPSRVSQIERTELPALLTQLSAIQTSMAARLIVTADESSERDVGDAMLTVEEAATRLGTSPDWLYRRTKSLPFVVRVGRHVRFSARGIDRYIRNRMGR